MGLQETPLAERIHIGFFGRRNAGKSSLLNAITNQELSIVSEIEGTTTDPVYKSMELLPLGPIVLMDTPGLDDEGALGKLRVEKAKQVLEKTDLALIVADARRGCTFLEEQLKQELKERGIPYLMIYNKSDLLEPGNDQQKEGLYVSARTGEGIENCKNQMAALVPKKKQQTYLIRDLIKPRDLIVLVTPIDESAPKGRLILPQQMTLREILDGDAIGCVTKETQLPCTLQTLGKAPALVITDSQVFPQVEKQIPKEIPLTSFSILMARYRGFLQEALEGTEKLDHLQEGNKILICEGCTHHRQCKDIGTVKIPRLLEKYTKKKLEFEYVSGMQFPKQLTSYALILHCGGCMLNDRELTYRKNCAKEQQVPFTNYGIFMAKIQGILERCVDFLK